MSIAEQITRLAAARDAQAAALSAKGVDVPEGAGFEDFPELTKEIPVGGSSEDFIALLTRNIKNLSTDATTIGQFACYQCNELASVDAPNVVTIGAEAFGYCSSLTRVVFPEVNGLGQGARVFRNCTNLVYAEFPRLLQLGSAQPGWFLSCTSLKTFLAPKMIGLSIQTFSGCTNLEFVEFESLQSFTYSQIFLNCTALKTLVLRYKGVVSLSNTNCFSGTPFAIGGTGGTVYVPQALIGSYRAATNWSALYEAGTCTFLPIEGSEYE